MALATDIPVSLGAVNRWQITGFEADTLTPALNIVLSRGFANPDTEVITWYGSEIIEVRGVPLYTAYLQPPQGSTVYDVIKSALYGYLKAIERIPADAEER